MDFDMIQTENAAHREFGQLMARSRGLAYNFAYRLTGNREDAEDLVQEAYLRAYRSYHTFDRSLRFESWLYRILYNLNIDGLRRKPKHAHLSLDQPMSEPGENGYTLEIADAAADPEVQVLKDVMDERLQSALHRLKKPYRTAVLLCDAEGMSYEEIARKMGTNVGTVRSRIHRGRRMLRKLIVTAPIVTAASCRAPT